jgi:hypothetical protein
VWILQGNRKDKNMIQRGRKSVAQLSVIRAETAFRPKPPAELTVEQAIQWRAIVNRLPADWFPTETWPLLAAFCRHSENAKRIAGLINAVNPDALRDPDSFRTYDKLLATHERETKAMSFVAVKLRLTPSSRLKAETASRMCRVVDVDVSALWGGDEGNDMAQLESPEKVP